MNLSAANHRSYAADHARGAAADPRVPRVSSAEEVVEAVQARAVIISSFSRPVVEDAEALAMAVQRQDHTLSVVGREAHRLLWLIGEMKVSLTQARQAGPMLDCEAFAECRELLALC